MGTRALSRMSFVTQIYFRVHLVSFIIYCLKDRFWSTFTYQLRKSVSLSHVVSSSYKISLLSVNYCYSIQMNASSPYIYIFRLIIYWELFLSRLKTKSFLFPYFYLHITVDIFLFQQQTKNKLLNIHKSENIMNILVQLLVAFTQSG